MAHTTAGAPFKRILWTRSVRLSGSRWCRAKRIRRKSPRFTGHSLRTLSCSGPLGKALLCLPLQNTLQRRKLCRCDAETPTFGCSRSVQMPKEPHPRDDASDQNRAGGNLSRLVSEPHAADGCGALVLFCSLVVSLSHLSLGHRGVLAGSQPV